MASDQPPLGELLQKYAAPVPRYTSYPTALQFRPEIGREQYAAWLAGLPDAARLSLYVHIPFCDTLCWFCGCSTKAVRRYDPVAEYLGVLMAEIGAIAARVAPRHRLVHVHWGGGSPNILSAADIELLAGRIGSSFRLAEGAEFAIEVDPRGLTADRVAALAAVGLTRASLGVQDFDDEVQAAVNRVQSYATTRRAVELFRRHGVRSINIDLLYGLPHQTARSLERTIEQVLTLVPDRIALFGYAHLPARMRHQRMIDPAALPGPVERFTAAQRAARRLTAAGYVPIGLDHFARPDDALATSRVHRNFQGYTSDAADALLGAGASAIGRLPQGYVQNALPTSDYARRVREHGLATVRGHELSRDDRMRAFAIERLMCDLRLPLGELTERFGADAKPLVEQAEKLAAADGDGLLERSGGGLRVTERGRPFIRAICARFDAYFEPGAGRHAPAV